MFMPRLVIGIFMMIFVMEAPTAFFIRYHCMAHRSPPELTFRSRAEICEEHRLAAGWRTLGDRLSRRVWVLQSESLLTEARRGTEREDFGDPPIEPALSILV